MSNFIPLARVISVEIYFFIRLNLKNSHLRLTEICMDLRFRRKKVNIRHIRARFGLETRSPGSTTVVLVPLLVESL